jgi:penicillin-binding protein 1C
LRGGRPARGGAAALWRAAWFGAWGGALALAVVIAQAAVPSFDAVRSSHRPSDITLTDRHGEPLQTLRVDTTARRLPWLPLAQVSPALRELVVQGEDQRFWSHGGVDWTGVARGALARTQGSTQGASTLTMQLAALLDPALARPAGGRGIGQKWTQIGAARELESRWSKTQILEAYLNLVPLRGELIGAPAASHALFGKHPSGLDRGEAALLVALLRAPNATPALVQRRACALLSEPPDCERIGILAERALMKKRTPPALVAGAIEREECAASGRAAQSPRCALAAPGRAIAAAADGRVAGPAGGGRRGRGARQREWRGAGLGRLQRLGVERRARGGRGAGAPPAGVDAQALRLCLGVRARPVDPGQPARRFARGPRRRQRRLHAAQLRPPLSRLGQRAHGTRLQPERAGGAHGCAGGAGAAVRQAQCRGPSIE